jgi:ATP-dependent DNA helicase RecQ
MGHTETREEEMNNKAIEILQKYFGYSQFKKGQQHIIEEILKGRDVLGIMPTGAGKSVCFQVPAMVLEGTAIVFSPLISLMKDQVDTLNDMGVSAAYINSSLGLPEYRSILSKAQKGEYKLLYIAPERLETEGFWRLLSAMEISLIAVDEAHCISQWGHDFRPSYTKISHMIKALPRRPVVAAFTATATTEVKEDIQALLALQNPYVLITGFDRENLYFGVAKPKDKFDFLEKYIRDKEAQIGVVYCATRKNVETVCEKLKKKGIGATRYHAGLSDKERSENQEAFLYDKAQVIVATNAFGMGIDKSNIRYVVHYNMPRTMENYYQEAGRAGRDGEKAACILLFSAADIMTNKLLIESSGNPGEKAKDYKKLQDMVDYCNTDGCLREYILNYFGETQAMEPCGNCGSCVNQQQSTDITIEAQKILSCVKRMGERFGSGLVIDVLRGSGSTKIKTLGFERLPTFGMMKEYSKETLKELISYLIAEDFAAVKGDKYPLLGIGSRGPSVLAGEEKVYIKRVIVKEAAKEAKREQEEDAALFEKLRTLRKEIAEAQHIPPFVVFSDAALKDMCGRLPSDEEEMLQVSGVGQFKLEKYGSKFLALIAEHAAAARAEASKPAAEIKESKKDTRLMTYELYTEGKSIKEICKERGLTQMTVEGHLLECLDRGMLLDYQAFIPAHHEGDILEAIEACGTEKLKPIKDALAPEVTYTAIRFAIWKYKNKI